MISFGNFETNGAPKQLFLKKNDTETGDLDSSLLYPAIIVMCCIYFGVVKYT